MRLIITLIVTIAISALISSCGQTGGLYLPSSAPTKAEQGGSK